MHNVQFNFFIHVFRAVYQPLFLVNKIIMDFYILIKILSLRLNFEKMAEKYERVRVFFCLYLDFKESPEKL